VILHKTVDDSRGVYRIFEAARDVFRVLDEGGRTVDQFHIVQSKDSTGAPVNSALRRKPLPRGIPNLARKFALERRRGERGRGDRVRTTLWDWGSAHSSELFVEVLHKCASPYVRDHIVFRFTPSARR
jgi:hypothetical protein